MKKHWYDYLWIFSLTYLVLGFFVVVASIIWYIVTVRYFRGIRRDKPFLEALDRKFREDILPQK